MIDMKRVISFAGLLTLAACVTVNVYFPASATEKAADRIIDDVWGPSQGAPPPAKPASTSDAGTLLVAALDFMMPAAQAAEPNLEISSPEILRLTGSMEARHASLQPQLASGAVGLTADGRRPGRAARPQSHCARRPQQGARPGDRRKRRPHGPLPPDRQCQRPSRMGSGHSQGLRRALDRARQHRLVVPGFRRGVEAEIVVLRATTHRRRRRVPLIV